MNVRIVLLPALDGDDDVVNGSENVNNKEMESEDIWTSNFR